MPTIIPTVLDGDDLTEDVFIATKAAVEELQAEMLRLTTVTLTSTTALLMDNIPQTFRQLLIVGTCNHNNGSAAGAIRDMGFIFNSDTSAGYDSLLEWAGSGASSATTENGTNGRIGQVSTVTSPFRALIPNYTGGIAKSLIGDFTGLSTTASSIRRGTATSRSPVTAALTRIDLTLITGGGDVFSTGSVVSLYGLP